MLQRIILNGFKSIKTMDLELRPYSMSLNPDSVMKTQSLSLPESQRSRTIDLYGFECDRLQQRSRNQRANLLSTSGVKRRKRDQMLCVLKNL